MNLLQRIRESYEIEWDYRQTICTARASGIGPNEFPTSGLRDSWTQRHQDERSVLEFYAGSLLADSRLVLVNPLALIDALKYINACESYLATQSRD